MATWTDYDSEHDAQLALAELTGPHLGKGEGGRGGMRLSDFLAPRKPELGTEEVFYGPRDREEPESDTERYVDLEAGS